MFSFRLENQANVQSTKFRDLAKNGYWFESVEHDIEDVYCGYRPRADRSIALKKKKKSKVMERSQRSDDSHYIHHERIVYEPRWVRSKIHTKNFFTLKI